MIKIHEYTRSERILIIAKLLFTLAPNCLTITDENFSEFLETLKYIFSFSRIIVLEHGIMAEYDTPTALIESKNSIFYGMAADAGLL